MLHHRHDELMEHIHDLTNIRLILKALRIVKENWGNADHQKNTSERVLPAGFFFYCIQKEESFMYAKMFFAFRLR